MEIIKGKEVYSELDELVRREHAAVLIIDMQKDGIAEEGYFAKRMGADVSPVKEIVAPLAEFLRQARSAQVQWCMYFRVADWMGKAIPLLGCISSGMPIS